MAGCRTGPTSRPDANGSKEIESRRSRKAMSCLSSSSALSLEDEKEAKKISRILANRKSARETIRRRQAIRDELTKRVSDLSSDNNKLKMEKELAMQEYKSLEETNQQLREQIAKTVWPKVRVTSSASQQTEDQKKTKKYHRILYNRMAARKSILKRQAIHQELITKVADLSKVNENLKKEKDLVMKEYIYMKDINKRLKEQFVNTIRPEEQGAVIEKLHNINMIDA